MNFATGPRCFSIRALTMLSAVAIMNIAYQPMARADCGQYDSAPADVGSVREYVTNSEPGSIRPPTHVPLLGVSVIPARTKMASGGEALGLAVASVDSASPAEDAGILGQRVNRRHVAEKIGAGVVVAGAGLIFPPALVGLALINKMGNNHTYDLIVAVDSSRTRSIFDLATALQPALPGEVVYVTVVRDGHLLQLRATVPNIDLWAASNETCGDPPYARRPN